MGAIPTRYNGVQFRSRLEARWAVMFDLLGWRWEYEPVDLEGYIPDFVLMFPAGGVLTEIKSDLTIEALEHSAAEKIDRSGWTSANIDDALILGATWNPPDASNVMGAGPLRQNHVWGRTAEDDEDELEPDWAWGEGSWIVCSGCNKPSICQEIHAWRCISCGEWGKVWRGGDIDVASLWADAGNAVQWRAPRGR